MTSLAIIPARGGSKRLKRKNIVDFHGEPIISYTIRAALKSGCFDRVVVSTDDKEIFKISSKYHNDIVIRPKRFSNDKSTVNEVCDNFLKNEIKKKRKYQFLTVLYPTAPMRTSNDIKNVLNKIRIEGFLSSLAVTTFSLPVHQALVLENGQAKKVFPKKFNLRENDIPTYYVDNGSTYSVIVEDFIKKRNLITKNPGLYFMPPERSVDIDTSYQLELAKYLYNKYHNKK